IVRRAVAELTGGGSDTAVRASDARRKARELLGRDSESLSERFFLRILRDAHDADVVDLRKRGNDYEVAMATTAAPIAQQLQLAEAPAAAADARAGEPSQGARTAATAAAMRRGMRPRGPGGRGRASAPPPELLMVGVLEQPTQRREVPALASSAATDVAEVATPVSGDSEPNIVPSVEPIDARPARGVGRGRGRGRVASKTAPSKGRAPAPSPVTDVAPAAEPATEAKVPPRGRARGTAKKGGKSRPTAAAPAAEQRPATLASAADVPLATKRTARGRPRATRKPVPAGGDG
ncbi:MAG: hypothetical protein M3373_05030, partial [Gemmatimonadota bacterium]|nr:hypothetical protein [Gemmatimonadota bacterium]